LKIQEAEMKKLIFLLIALLVMPSIALAAKGGKPPPAPVCGLTGVWAGFMEVEFAEGGILPLEFYGTHTSMDGLKGEMLLNWRYSYLDNTEGLEMLLPGTGVWELIDSDTGTYSFTWYSQVTFEGWSGCTKFRSVRVSGTAQMNGCNEVTINYRFDTEYEYPECELTYSTFSEGTAYGVRVPIYTPPAAE
jgi:hypothetical protein